MPYPLDDDREDEMDGEDDPASCEPQSGDWLTYDHRSLYEAEEGPGSTYPNKLLAIMPEERDDFEVWVREIMVQQHISPSVFFVSDHGNAHLITLD